MLSATTKEAAGITKDLAANDIKNSAQNVKREAGEAATTMVHDISEYASQTSKKVRDFITSADSEIHDASEKVTHEIRTNPVRSSTIALGIGFILGVLYRR